MQLTKGVMTSLRTNMVTFTMEQIVLVTRPPIARTVVPANLDLQTKAIGVFVLLVLPMKSVKLILTNVHQTNTTAVMMQCVTILKDRSTVPVNQGLLATEANVKTSTNVQREHIIAVIMPCVRIPREDTAVPANLASQAMDGIVQILMNVAKDPMTASLALLPAQILLDHTTVLVSQDLREMERQVA